MFCGHIINEIEGQDINKASGDQELHHILSRNKNNHHHQQEDCQTGDFQAFFFKEAEAIIKESHTDGKEQGGSDAIQIRRIFQDKVDINHGGDDPFPDKGFRIAFEAERSDTKGDDGKESNKEQSGPSTLHTIFLKKESQESQRD